MSDLRKELGLKVLVVSFDHGANNINISALDTIKGDVKKILTEVKPMPKETNHVYVTVHSSGEIGCGIESYDVMYRRREGHKGNNYWKVDKLLELYERVTPW